MWHARLASIRPYGQYQHWRFSVRTLAWSHMGFEIQDRARPMGDSSRQPDLAMATPMAMGAAGGACLTSQLVAQNGTVSRRLFALSIGVVPVTLLQQWDRTMLIALLAWTAGGHMPQRRRIGRTWVVGMSCSQQKSAQKARGWRGRMRPGGGLVRCLCASGAGPWHLDHTAFVGISPRSDDR